MLFLVRVLQFSQHENPINCCALTNSFKGGRGLRQLTFWDSGKGCIGLESVGLRVAVGLRVYAFGSCIDM